MSKSETNPKSEAKMPLIGVLLSDDLLFTSRISGTARALGLELRTVRNAAALEELLQQRHAKCVIVDLHNPGLDLPKLIAALRQGPLCTIIGYGSHVAADVLHAARVAGCDVVLPRSKFVETLAEELPHWFGGKSTKPPSDPS